MATVAGGLLTYASQRQAAEAQASKAEYDAAVSRNNAKLAEYQARDTREVGRIQEQRHRARISRTVGTARSVLASSGFDVTQDDAPALIGEIVETGEIEARTIRANAENRARGLDFQAANLMAQGGAFDAAAEVSPLTGVGALVSTFGAVADRWHSYSSRGATPSSTPSLHNVYT